MKLRITIFIALAVLVLTACNVTLAQDVTPPPGYVQPTPAPTLGPLYPPQAPDVQNGAAIFAEKCAACHGNTGLGDGAQGKQLPVTVAALGLPEIAAESAPADWFLTVTRGNIDRYMPPFASLNEQERWDVVYYALTLSTATDQIEQGQAIYEANCVTCHTDGFSPERAAAMSADYIINTTTNGAGDKMPAFADFSADELWGLASYLRTTVVAASAPTPEAATVEPTESAPTETPASEGEPSAVETPVGSTEQAEVPTEAPKAGFGPVNGTVVNGSGGEVPSHTIVTLRGFMHASDPNSTPQEVATETALVNSDGSYALDEIDLSEGLIYIAQMDFGGVTYQSELAFSEAGITELTIPPLTFYETTTEMGALVIEQLHISFDFAVDGGAQVFEVFNIKNLSNKTIVVESDGLSIPFMPMPTGAVELGFELSQQSARLLPAENGFALPPTEELYSIIAFFSLPYEKELEFTQPLELSATSMVVIVPEGIKLESDQLSDDGLQATSQGANIHLYSSDGLNAGEDIKMSISGKVKQAGESNPDSRQMLLIGAGVLGLLLIGAGVWMFLRDRNRDEDEDDDDDDFEDEDEDDEFDNAEDVMDAIIALDDLYRAKKISEEAYQKRREELKERLKELA